MWKLISVTVSIVIRGVLFFPVSELNMNTYKILKKSLYNYSIIDIEKILLKSRELGHITESERLEMTQDLIEYKRKKSKNNH